MLSLTPGGRGNPVTSWFVLLDGELPLSVSRQLVFSVRAVDLGRLSLRRDDSAKGG
jgi:hypothetical protein